MLFGSLSDDDVRQIAALVEALDHSGFDSLQLQVGEVKLTLGKGAVPTVVAPVAAPVAVAPRSTDLPALAPVEAPRSTAAVAAPGPAADGTVAIVAPILGMFYACPEPGAQPFVTVGAAVAEDSTVALIEVMKVFNAARAGVSGVVTEVCVKDCTYVEYGQVLFRVRPA